MDKGKCCKESLKKDIYYILAFVIGLALTLLIFFKDCDCVSKTGERFLDFSVMIGCGVFCSALVSYIVELQNRERVKQMHEAQRRYILMSARVLFVRLFERELYEFSKYYEKYLIKQRVELVRENINVLQIKEKLVRLTKEIILAESKRREGTIYICPESIERDEHKGEMLKRGMFYYKQLYESLLKLSSDYNVYLIAGVITEQNIELLKELMSEVEDIVRFGSNDDYDEEMVWEFKQILFEKMEKFLPTMDISEHDETKVSYKNVFKDIEIS